MFEHSLIGLQERKKSRHGWFSLPMAVLIHLVALGTFAFASYWDIDEVTEPSINLVFIGEGAPPPPPPLSSDNIAPEDFLTENSPVAEFKNNRPKPGVGFDGAATPCNSK